MGNKFKSKLRSSECLHFEMSFEMTSYYNSINTPFKTQKGICGFFVHKHNARRKFLKIQHSQINHCDVTRGLSDVQYYSPIFTCKCSADMANAPHREETYHSELANHN